MSLLNNNFIGSDGSPITGRVPTQLIVRNDDGEANQMSPALYSAVKQAYSQFCDTVRLSSFPDGYHTQDVDFEDGAKARFESNNGVQRAMVWPVGGGGRMELITFFAIPFGAEYITEKVEKVFIKKRWPDTTKELFQLADVLENFNHSERFAMVGPTQKKKFHPGNTTWFAKCTPEEKHPAEHIVLSWWGQPNRYSKSVVDEFGICSSNVFTTNNRAAFFKYSDGLPGVGGWGNTQTADGYWLSGGGTGRGYVAPHLVDLAGVYTHLQAPAVWINGMLLNLPNGEFVYSACLAKRVLEAGEITVLRVLVAETTADLRTFGSHLLEMPLSKAFDFAVKGIDADQLTQWEKYPLPESLVENTISPYQLHGEHAAAYPPYWNKSGTEAVTIIRTKAPSGDIMAPGFGAVCLKMLVSAGGGITCAVVKWDEVQCSVTSDWTENAAGGFSATRVLAADYVDDTLHVLSSTHNGSFTSVETVGVGDEALQPMLDAAKTEHFDILGGMGYACTQTDNKIKVTTSYSGSSQLLLNDTVLVSRNKTDSREFFEFRVTTTGTKEGAAGASFVDTYARGEVNDAGWQGLFSIVSGDLRCGIFLIKQTQLFGSTTFTSQWGPLHCFRYRVAQGYLVDTPDKTSAGVGNEAVRAVAGSRDEARMYGVFLCKDGVFIDTPLDYGMGYMRQPVSGRHEYSTGSMKSAPLKTLTAPGEQRYIENSWEDFFNDVLQMKGIKSFGGSINHKLSFEGFNGGNRFEGYTDDTVNHRLPPNFDYNLWGWFSNLGCTGGGLPLTAFTATACTPDKNIFYLAYTSHTVYQNDAPHQIIINKWFVNGEEVTLPGWNPDSDPVFSYANPVFTGPLPPLRYLEITQDDRIQHAHISG